MHFPEFTQQEKEDLWFKHKLSVSKPGLYRWIGVKVSFQPCSLLILAFPLGADVDCLTSLFASVEWIFNARWEGGECMKTRRASWRR